MTVAAEKAPVKSRLLWSIVLILIGIAVLTVLYLWAETDVRLDNFRSYYPVYPGAEITLQETDTLQFMWSRECDGRIELYSEDDPDTVADWYNRTIATRSRAARMEDDALPAWKGNWEVVPLEDGSRVILTQGC